MPSTDVAADVLSGTVCLDRAGNARLEGGFDMPTRRDVSSMYGVRASDDRKIATSLIDAVRKIFFKCKPHTTMKKLMDAYATRQGVNRTSVRFLFDGERITDQQTPKDLGLEEGDSIDVVMEQVGGAGI